MSDYQVNNTIIDSLQFLLNQFDVLIQSPRQAIIVNSEATKRLKELFKHADKTLKHELDGLMLRYKESNPDFYDEYINARIIIDLGVKNKKKR